MAHAGEVRLDFVEPENSRKHEANKKADCLIRLEEELKIIGDLLEERRRICSEARQEIRREIVEKPQEKVDFEWIAKKLHEFNELLEIEDYIDYAIFITDFDRLKAFTTQPKAQQTSKGYFVDSTDFDFDERLAYVAESLKYLSELKLVDRDGWLSLKANIKNLNSIQNTYRYLFKIAEIFLEIVRDVFEDMNPAILELQSSESGINKNWQLSPDTGWYSYLFATCINQVGLAKDVVLQHRASFNRIDNHPDTIGFRIEQREARASFDDWRFMNTKGVEGEENLAHIRSHDSDAFFGSEYQSFLYFPSDPQFLMDQYEETVRLMMRLSVMLKGYNSLAYDMIRKVRNYLSMVNHKKGRVSPDTSRLGTFLQEIGDLRLGASETISLTANAGISRYKDHGILMTKITEKMKLNSVIKSINDQLDSLDFITRNILASLEAKRERTLTRTGLLLTLLFTAITVDTLVKALFSFRIDFISFRVNAVLELLQRITEGAWTILLWSFVSVAIVIWYRLKNK